MLCIKAGIHKGEIVIKKIIKYSAQPEYFLRVFIDQSYFGLWFEIFLLYQQKNTRKLTGYISLLFLQKGFVPGLFEEKEIGTGCCQYINKNSLIRSTNLRERPKEAGPTTFSPASVRNVPVDVVRSQIEPVLAFKQGARLIEEQKRV